MSQLKKILLMSVIMAAPFTAYTANNDGGPAELRDAAVEAVEEKVEGGEQVRQLREQLEAQSKAHPKSWKRTGLELAGAVGGGALAHRRFKEVAYIPAGVVAGYGAVRVAEGLYDRLPARKPKAKTAIELLEERLANVEANSISGGDLLNILNNPEHAARARLVQLMREELTENGKIKPELLPALNGNNVMGYLNGNVQFDDAVREKIGFVTKDRRFAEVIKAAMLGDDKKIRPEFLDEQEAKLDGDAVVTAVLRNQKFNNLVDARIARKRPETKKALLADVEFVRDLATVVGAALVAPQE